MKNEKPAYHHLTFGGDRVRGPMTREAAVGLNRLCADLGRQAIVYGQRPDDPDNFLPILFALPKGGRR